jgi:hypothetical protein
MTSTGVAVLAKRRGNEAKVERKHHSFGQEPSQHEEVGRRVVVEFVAEATGRFYDGAADAFFCVQLVSERRQIGHTELL